MPDPSQSINIGATANDGTGDPLRTAFNKINGGSGSNVPLPGTGWFSPFAYGAFGDGATDDTTAIQAALTAAGNAGGGLVHLAANTTFLFTAQLNVPNDVSIVGAGWSSVLYTNSQAIWGLVLSSRNYLAHFKLLGPGADYNFQFGNGGAVKCSPGTSTVSLGSQNNLVEHCWITEWNRNAINFDTFTAYNHARFNRVERNGCEGIYGGKNADYCTIIGNVILDCEYNAIDINGLGTQVEGNIIRNVGHLFDATGVPTHAGDSRGIVVLASPTAGSPIDHHKISGNYVENTRGEGIHIFAVSGGVVSKVLLQGNDVTAAGAAGIVVEAGDSSSSVNHVQVLGNHSRGNTTHGIYVHAAADCQIDNNDCNTNTLDGIRIFDGGANQCLRNSLVGNRCTGNTGFGITIQDTTAADTKIVGNTLLSNTAGHISDSGNFTRKLGNATSVTTLGGTLVNQLDGPLKLSSTTVGDLLLELAGAAGGPYSWITSEGCTAYLGAIANGGTAGYGGTFTNHPYNIRSNNADRVKIGAAGELHFSGGTPVAKPTLNAASVDLATVIALCNQIRTALINNGLTN